MTVVSSFYSSSIFSYGPEKVLLDLPKTVHLFCKIKSGHGTSTFTTSCVILDFNEIKIFHFKIFNNRRYGVQNAEILELKRILYASTYFTILFQPLYSICTHIRNIFKHIII